MCGIFGIYNSSGIDESKFARIAQSSERRGRDSSGVALHKEDGYLIYRANSRIGNLISSIEIGQSNFAIGHTRLITNGERDNQPLVCDDIIVIHNGIIVNDSDYWLTTLNKRNFQIDTEVILSITKDHLRNGLAVELLDKSINAQCKGSVSCAIVLPNLGKLVLYSNTGSLYISESDDGFVFASENSILKSACCKKISQIKGLLVKDIPISTNIMEPHDKHEERENLIHPLTSINSQEKRLVYKRNNIKRCSKCILPETMPFIKFDRAGVCNYCNNYVIRNKRKDDLKLIELIDKYKSTNGNKCIVPFSGGRDSSFALHYITKELGMNAITMTYDWGMVTDLARRNISRMCAELGVENILIADDIQKKRNYIRTNLVTWLKKPDLGMLNILMAGDKHFFRYIEDVKNETGITLNIWGMNPLEVTHFKAGFLGYPPFFETDQVFYTGFLNQLKYQKLRLDAMLKNPGYFNRSLWDTLSGEYYRSVKKKTDFYNIFDYVQWDEKLVNSTILQYGWETAVDTNSTWRIGDGTAAFYNYVYYTIAGFTENDTFRSNQIREGQMTRDRALQLVDDENMPRYQNIKWYLEVLNLDFDSTIDVINSIPKLY